jgi:hypothetical protein
VALEVLEVAVVVQQHRMGLPLPLPLHVEVVVVVDSLAVKKFVVDTIALINISC